MATPSLSANTTLWWTNRTTLPCHWIRGARSWRPRWTKPWRCLVSSTMVSPKVDETMVLDTKQRREMLQLAVDAGERSQLAPSRMRVPALKVLSGKTDQKEYVLSSKLTVIGKSEMATVRLRGWFAPDVAPQINKRGE